MLAQISNVFRACIKIHIVIDIFLTINLLTDRIYPKLFRTIVQDMAYQSKSSKMSNNKRKANFMNVPQTDCT